MRWPGELAVDIGANVGFFSQLLSPHFRTVAAVETDHAALEHLYSGQRRGELSGNIRPIQSDILNPTGGRDA